MSEASRFPLWTLLCVALLVVNGCTSADKPRRPTNPGLSSATSTRNATEIRGLTLEPAASIVRRYCRVAARRLHRQVPCPTVVPGSTIQGLSPRAEYCFGRDDRLGSRPCFRADVFGLGHIFAAPNSYVGLGHGAGHLNIWSAPRASMEGQGLGCESFGQHVGRTEVQGRDAEFFSCPARRHVPPASPFPIDSGHVLLQWRRGDFEIGVSLHGHTGTNRLAASFVARRLLFIGQATGHIR